MLKNYRVTLIKGDERYNVTHLVGNLTRKSSIDTLGEEISFDKSKSTSFSKVEFKVGDGLLIQNLQEEIFRGIIVDKSESGLFQQSYIAFDYAFYLNKSETIFQCNNIRADEAIKDLCSKFNIPVGNITDIRTLINHIYNDCVSNIIKNIIDKSTNDLNVKYRLEMRFGKLHLEAYRDLIVRATFRGAFNLKEFDITNLIGNFSRSRSIADMKNSIVIVSDNEKASRVIASEKDDVNIARYGLLQMVENVSDKDVAQARNIAKNKLSEFNKVIESVSIELLGSDKVKAGRILEINDYVTSLSGYYLVKECTHSYSSGIHKMQLTIETTDI